MFPQLRLIPSAAAALCAAFLLTGCTQSAVQSAPAKQADEPPDTTPYNDTARFLAGLKGRPDGPFHELEQTDAWKDYAARFDQTWEKAQTGQFAPVDAFQKRELAGIHTPSQYVFYPFSGPDVLYLLHFFPDTKLTVFASLEPVGNLRKPDRYKADTLGKELNGWSKALESIFVRSFFVTSEMDQTFRGQQSDGLIATILLLLARSDCTIQDVKYGRIADSGEFVLEGDPVKKHEGMEVFFHRRGETETRKLYYFSTDLAAGKDGVGGFEHDPRFSRFLDRQGTPDTLVKSASFLLHWRMCQALRNYILDRSNLVLQDDTGIPYAYFKPGVWKVDLFGEYSHPDHPFTKEWQPDLDRAFHEPGRVRELGFSLGYGAYRRPSSLILAVREHPLNAQAARQ